MNRLRLPLFPPIIVALGFVCGSTAAGQSGLPIVRDSGQVRIVEYSSIPASLPLWVVEDEPLLRIGSIDGTGPDVFGRITSAVELSDGSIVVVDAQALELRAFAPGGENLWVAGGPGGGPGEFNRLLNAMWRLRGDSILVVEGPRLNVFDAAGAYSKNMDLRSPAPLALGRPGVAGVLGNGTVIGIMRMLTVPITDGRYRDWYTYAYFGADGNMTSILGSFPGPEGARRSDSIIIDGEVNSYTVMTSVQMNRRSVLAAGDTRVAIADQAQFEVLHFGLLGRLELIVRVLEPLVPFDRSRYERLHPDRSCGRGGCWQDAALPDTLPALGRMLFDAAGRLWVERFMPEYEDGQPEWRVFTSGGSLIARVIFPVGFTPYQLGDDYVIGMTLDEYGVNYIEKRMIVAGP